jgi:hypothetical protein
MDPVRLSPVLSVPSELFLAADSIMESYRVDAPQRQLFVSWDFGDFCDFYPAE